MVTAAAAKRDRNTAEFMNPARKCPRKLSLNTAPWFVQEGDKPTRAFTFTCSFPILMEFNTSTLHNSFHGLNGTRHPEVPYPPPSLRFTGP